MTGSRFLCNCFRTRCVSQQVALETGSPKMHEVAIVPRFWVRPSVSLALPGRKAEKGKDENMIAIKCENVSRVEILLCLPRILQQSVRR